MDFETMTMPQRKKILIVDDDFNMVKAVRRLLQSVGLYEIDIALDGFEAQNKWLSFCPDLIILDIRMPGMDGQEVARAILKNNGFSKPKIMAVSAFFEDQKKENLIALGVSVCLDKPSPPDVFLDIVKKLLQDKDGSKIKSILDVVD